MKLGEKVGEGAKSTIPTVDDRAKRALAAAKVIYATYKRVIGPGPEEYARSVCRQLFKDYEAGLSEDEAKATASYHANRLETLRKQISIHYDTVYNLAGAGDLMRNVEVMLKEVADAVVLVEDIDALVHSGVETLITAYRGNELLFQQ
ncbi:hypothetical protein CC1G_02078 [Coprinopsis cinerea okayama7|uniref:Uncharacterized protein n=1 Tax=Coprinopsis cinerea (strain Okayama-7 / 130 / ATCC MYA-4618 / FGSC 9003) TaxID=240176 RepID=A8NK38_COPC7|nr:hypothetical protein CC1G_02078 [Coprinopsis cinerea okayama7\|eukprot:XP_001834342.2 hypothetical protein CC1G_02078 [Coprinopsis cinerea okayama7\